MKRGVFVALVLSALITITTCDKKCLCNIKKHEVPTDCFSTCGNTCASQGKIINCPIQLVANCKPGCICAKGYIRLNNSTDSPCVRISSCPSDESTDFNCGPNTVPIPAEGCVDFCPPTCPEPLPKLCPRICISEGCNCKEGYIRSEFKNSSCIPISRCRCIKQKRAMEPKLDNVQHAD